MVKSDRFSQKSLALHKMTDKLSPIALFTYNRPWHTRQTVESLAQNELAADSHLFIFSDGSRSADDEEAVSSVREYAKTISGFKSLNIIERERNLGLADSIIRGVTEIVDRFAKVIVLEDDMITSPYFLRFMNEGLGFYERDERVISIHGYIYPVKKKLPETFFIKGADCWGWATWKRGWDLFEADGQKLLREIKKRRLQREFDFNGSYPYTQMLEDQVSGKNNSWAVRWYASAFLKDRFTLYPGKPLVQNIGLDNSGTHCSETDVYNTELSQTEIKVTPVPVEENMAALKEIERYFKAARPGRFSLMRSRVINIFNKIYASESKRG